VQRGAHVVVATPGRVLDHLRRGTIEFSGLAAVVLDEADEMLDMGFAEDLEQILEATPAERQTALFSATLPRRIVAIAEAHLRDPARVHIPQEISTKGALPRVRRSPTCPASPQGGRLGRGPRPRVAGPALVFCGCGPRSTVLAQTLSGRGFRVEALHGGMSQDQRDRVMRKGPRGTSTSWSQPDVAARGIDIEKLSHVVNFDVRRRRTTTSTGSAGPARAGRGGVAISWPSRASTGCCARSSR